MENTEQARVFTINDERIADTLNDGGILAENITQQDEFEEAAEHGSIIVVNPNARTNTFQPNNLVPHAFLIKYHELVEALILEGKQPSFDRRPWRPATFVRCDPDAVTEPYKFHMPKFQMPKLNLPELHMPEFLAHKKINKPEPKKKTVIDPNESLSEMYSAIIEISSLVRMVRKGLDRNIKMEVKASKKGIQFVTGPKHRREKYVCDLVRQVEGRPPRKLK